MKKKILSLILVAAMLASMLVFAPTAGAITEPKASVDVTETAGLAGDTVTVDVVAKYPGSLGLLDAFMGCFVYDTTRLELVARTRGDVWGDYSGTEAGEYDNSIFESYVMDGIRSVCAYGGTADATEGVVAFTLTFKIKEDAPAGDAAISFCNLGYITRIGSTDNPLYKAEDVQYFGGKVTVLDGYAPVTNPADFEISDNGDGTCTIVEYLGDASVLNIPSEIDGLTVVGIGSMIFCEVDHDTFKIVGASGIQGNDTVRTIIVPATVKEIGSLAFMNANVCENIIVLGDALDYVAGDAFGFVGGTWQMTGAASKKFLYKNDAWPMGTEWDEEAEDWVYTDEGFLPVGNVKLTIVNADSLGADFEAENGIDGNCLTYTTKVLGAIKTAGLALTIGEETVNYTAFGAVIKAPTFDGVVAWKDAEGNVYAPGEDLGDVTAITAVVAETPVTAKITDEFAMLFQATFTKATYDEMAALGEVTMGMLITPRQYVVKAGNVFTMDALDALVEGTGYAGYVKVIADAPISAVDATGAATTDFANCVAFNIAGGINGLKETTAAKNPEFVAIGFLQVTLENGDVQTVYSNYNNQAITVSSFLATVDTDGLGDTELGWINAWKDLFN